MCVEAKAPAGKECIWSNSTALRVALLAWGGRCAVARFSLALRPASGGAWTDLSTDGEIAEVILCVKSKLITRENKISSYKPISL